MAVTFTYPGLNCPRLNVYVPLDQTEQRCRSDHQCGPDGTCPLKDEFGDTSLQRTLALLAAEVQRG